MKIWKWYVYLIVSKTNLKVKYLTGKYHVHKNPIKKTKEEIHNVELQDM